MVVAVVAMTKAATVAVAEAEAMASKVVMVVNRVVTVVSKVVTVAAVGMVGAKRAMGVDPLLRATTTITMAVEGSKYCHFSTKRACQLI